MSKINVSNQIDNWVGFFIAELVNDQILTGNFDPENVEIELKINNVECDFEDVVNHIGGQYDSMVKDAAKKLFEENTDDVLLNKLNNLGFLADRLEEQVGEYVEELYNK